MSQATFVEEREDHIAVHIFSVSAGMVGVCLTVIGLVNVISSVTKTTTLVDDITAIDAIIFLLSCIISYFAIKKESRKFRFALEKIADGFFILGLLLMVVVCFLFVYKIA